MTTVLAVDLGTTGVKVAVVDGDGAVRGVAGEVIPLLFVEDGGVEQDPNVWWAAVGRCARQAIASSATPGDDIGFIALTSQYTSTTPVDRQGMPLANTIIWMDGRGPAHRSPFSRDVERFVDTHGLVPGNNDDVSHIDVLRALLPDVYAATFAFVEPMDALAARMTGRVTATQNTMFPMLACDNRTWGSVEYSDDVIAMSGLPADKLPPLVALGEPRGRVTAECAAHLGVSSKAVVTGATIDSVTAAVGTGAISPDRCGVIIGTTAVMAAHLPDKRHDIRHGLTSAPSPLPDSWVLVAENGVGGKALDVFVNNLVFADDGLGHRADETSYQRVLDAAATSPCGSNGVLFLPWLVGSMAPSFDVHQRGGLVNIGLASTRSDMARAVLEGVAMNVSWLLPHFSRLADRHYDEITFGGGGARSPLWGQILADACGTRVRRLARSSCTNAHGAALLALSEIGECALGDLPELLVTAEVHEPDPAGHRLLSTRTATLRAYHAATSAFYENFDDSNHKENTQ